MNAFGNYNNKFQKETDVTTNPVIQGIKEIINKAKTYSSPEELAQSLATANSPAMQQAVGYVKSQGTDPKTACLNLLRSNGIDPDEISKIVSGL